MESASSRSERLREQPRPAAKNRWLQQGTALLLSIGLVMLSASSHRWGYAPAISCLVLVTTLAAGWMFHLRAASLPQDWAFVLAAMLAGQLAWTVLRLRPAGSVPLLAFGNGLFVYAMLWVFAIHEREPGLRPLATAALILSIGILAAPAVVIACALLSLVFFLDQKNVFRSLSNLLLLLFTPMLLCVLTTVVLDAVTQGSLRNAARSFWLQNRIAGDPVAQKFVPQQVCGFLLAAGALLSRLWERQSKVCDLALIGLLGFLATIGRAHWMPERLSIADLSILACAAGACLIALMPPRTNIGRLIVFGFLAIGLWLCVFPNSVNWTLSNFNIS